MSRKHAVAPFPGTGLSYAELCANEHGSEIRDMWIALANFADTIGVPTMVTGLGARTATTDELVQRVSTVLPAGFDLYGAVKATEDLFQTRAQQRNIVFEVRTLKMRDGVTEWVVAFTSYTPQPAMAQRTVFAERFPDEVFIIVETESTVTHNLI